ncbi:hypothetical protein MHYP_G00202450 [Metynnis hypsauchen]
MMAGSSLISSLFLVTCVLLPLCAAQASCRGRCGEPFIRGQLCNCDNNCITHDECCKDYEDVCTSRGSCRGRCGETFQRGKECECDPDCTLYNTCCSDYHQRCDAADRALAAKSAKESKPTGPPKTKPQKKPDMQPLKAPKKPSDSDSEERSRAFSDYADAQVGSTPSPAESGPGALRRGAGPAVLDSLSELMPLVKDPADPTVAPLPLNPGLYTVLPANPAANAPALGGPAAGSPQPGASSSGKSLTIPIKVSLSISGHAGGPAGGAGRPSTLADITQALGANIPAGLPYESSSPDLCNGLPIDALTSLFNGSIIVFRGQFFWLLDPKTRAAGPAQSITEQLGVPSPIDTAFTRCNCQGKTFIIKGDNYWVFENGMMEPGYPRSLSQDFDGLSGEISAALSVPATRKRPEAIYFFKKGGTMQKFSYPAGSGPTCSGKKMKNSVFKNRRARQAEIRLSAEININLNWKGFPTPVTSALSAPNPRKPDGFEYFIFSWPKFFNIKISGEFPTLASPAKPPAQQNDIRNWLNCP